MYPRLRLEILNPTPIDVSDYLLSHSLDRGDVSQVGASGVDGIVSSLSFALGNSGQYQCQWDSEAVVDSETVLDGEKTFDSEDDVCLLLAYLFQTEPTLARDSFSPRDGGSRFNNPTPLLYPNREVVFYVDDVERWRGYIREIKPGRSKVDVVAYDPAKMLQDAYIYTSKEYGSEVGVPAEDVIQQIIDDNIGIYPEYSLYTPISPSFLVTPYKVEYESVWDAIQKVASMIGWYLGYRYIDGQFRLTFLEPPRLKDTPDFELDADREIYTQDLAISDIDVRNFVKVTYRDKASKTRKFVTVQDNDSIAQFGKRSMEVEEADTSLIDTEAEALRLANAVLHDLSSLPATTNLRLPYTPELDTFSTVAVRNPLISSTVDFYAVESVRHYGTPDRLRTEAICSGKVIGGRSVWLQKETRKGRPAEPIRGTEIAVGEIDTDRINDGATTTEKIAQRAVTVGDSFVFETDSVDSTTSLTPVPAPNYNLSFEIDEESLVLISCSAHLWVHTTTTEFQSAHGICYIEWYAQEDVSGSQLKLWQGKIAAGEWGQTGSLLAVESGATQSFTRSLLLSPGKYSIKAYFYAGKARDYFNEEIIGSIASRYINIIVLKR